jgi:transcriptional regulator with XRE-family HTH domain
MKMDWVKFGRDLRRVRKDANLPLREAAERCGIHYTVLSRTERGKYVGLGAPYYLALCHWMRVDPFKYFKP